MEDPTDPPINPELSQAVTLGGTLNDGQSALPPGMSAGAPPEFPLKDQDRYEPLRFLGQGGMGVVFLALDRRLGREVAIKFVRIDDARHLDRFLLEARAQARVDHEHVCKVFEVGEVDGRVFITMQHIAGLSLDVAAPDLTLEQKVIVLRDAARGIHEAHRVGIIHRDLKPSNIMVERAEDGSLRAFVMDFGLAREWNQDMTETGSVLGTPAYMSPEQARGEVSRLDRRTDIYSLGATLYQVILGRAPVSGTNALEILSAIASAEILPMRTLRMDIPRDLEAITLKCLERERAKRYDSARALADDLEHFLAGEPVQARPAGLWYRTQRRFVKHKQLVAVGMVALVVVGVALAMVLKARIEAGKRERLAQHFTESLGRMESMARYSALSPLHDIRPDLEAVRALMARLQSDMKESGALARGPGHYALGRGYWTLDDGEKAWEHLQMAWDAGFREPRVAFWLAMALGRRYQEKLLEAERLPSAGQREARKKAIETTLRGPALTFLRQAKGAEAPSPAYLEALMAFYEGRLDEALERLKTVEGDLPWFYEAPLLRGSLLQARAWKLWNQGARDAALADFERGRQDLALAAASGRSAPGVHAALAELELNALIMEKYGQGRVQPAFERGMVAVRTALRAQPDHVPSLILEAALIGHLAEYRLDHGEKAVDLIQEAVALAERARVAGPTRVDAWVALGRAYYQWGSARQDRDLDPSEQLERGLRALESLSPEKRDYTVENLIGLIHQTWSDADVQQGKDAAAHLSGAIEAYQRATRMEPHMLPAWINLGTCLQQRAVLPRATNPEGDLQEALKVLERAQALNPMHFVPYFVRGKVFFCQALSRLKHGGDPESELIRSIEANRQGIAINAGDPHLHNGIGVAQLELARSAWEHGRDPGPFLAGGQSAFRQAIAVAPNQVLGYLNLGDLLMWKARHEPEVNRQQTLKEAEATLHKALVVAPEHPGSPANLGRLCAVRIEGLRPIGGDPAPLLRAGEGHLAKVLARDPQHRDALQYLGELRGAALRLKARQGKALQKDFESAEQPLGKALKLLPDSQESSLELARLCLARAAWEQDTALDAAASLARVESLLEGLLRARPRWGEALAIRGALSFQEARLLPPESRDRKVKEACRAFSDAFAINPNLVREWKPDYERAQLLGKSGS